MSDVLGLVASSCGGVETRLCAELAEPASARGWRLAITLTPSAARWLEATGELERLASLSPFEVRSTARLPSEPRPHPDPDAFLFAPASVNSVAKLALAIADNQALTAVGEAVGMADIPVVLGYRVRDSYDRHPAWQRHVATLASAQVRLRRLTGDRSWTDILDLLAAQ